MEQAAAGLNSIAGFNLDTAINPREKNTLRSLAQKVADLAAHPREEEKKNLWIRHNDLRSTQPIIFCDPENGWNEIITQEQILCENPLLRVWEMHLRKEIYWAEEMKDDRVIQPFFYVPYRYTDTEWGLREKKLQTDLRRGSYVWKAPIENYDRDFAGLSSPEIIIDRDGTDRAVVLAEELLGDILKVRLRNAWWWTLGMTWDFVKLRGLENLMTDMIDQPDNVHRLMDFLSNGLMKKIDFLEKEGLLSSNTSGTYVGSGGFGWTRQLPEKNSGRGQVAAGEMWGFAESQETVGVSPEMFGEFIFPYQLPILDRFGLNCYGCCEPLDKRWHIIRDIPRLRRVSVSPWADLSLMSEYLNAEYIFSLKPAPSQLALPELDEEEVRGNLRNSIRATKSNFVELIMKDNHTLGGNPHNATRWVEIAREEIGNI
ncbi:MAG: hypothetical protein HN368_24250 [Spirochaetales bacterium]|nr:hypothetical protein [Spirochaetales bacterium]